MKKAYQIFVVDDLSDNYGFSPICRIFGDYEKAKRAALEILESNNKDIREENEKWPEEQPEPEYRFLGLVVHNGENVDNFPYMWGRGDERYGDIYVVEFNIE